jgi:hypothetical protein
MGQCGRPCDTLNNLFKSKLCPITSNFSNPNFKQSFKLKPIPTWPYLVDKKIIVEIIFEAFINKYIVTILFSTFFDLFFFKHSSVQLTIIKLKSFFFFHFFHFFY